MKIMVSTNTFKATKNRNEDDLIVWQCDGNVLARKNKTKFSLTSKKPICVAVSDGVSTSVDGEKSSRTALDTLEQLTVGEDVKESLEEWMDQVNQSVGELNKEFSKEALCTLTCGVFTEQKVYFSNIGDSPCYRFRNGKLEQLATLHTLAKYKEIKGISDIDEYDSHVLLRYVGNRESQGRYLADYFESDIQKGDIYIICSDGLEVIKDLEKQLKKKWMDAYKLSKIALKNADDNISVIMINIQ